MFEFVPYFRVLVLNAALSVMVGILAWRRRRRPGGACLTGMMGALALWQGVAALESAAVSLDAKLFWSTLEYAGAGSTAVVLLLFARNYAGVSRPIRLLPRLLLWAFPVVAVAMAATNRWHGLIWTDITPGPPGSNQVVYRHGALFWLVTFWFYAYLAAAVWILLNATRPTGHLSRRQIRPVLFGMVFPWVASVLYVLDMNPVAGLNLVPASFLPTALIFLYVLLREGLLDLVPVARDRVVESMAEGVVVTTADWVVVDVNPAAEALLDVRAAVCLGRPVSTCVPELSDYCSSALAAAIDVGGTFDLHHGEKVLSMKRSVVKLSQGDLVGHVLLFVDVTHERQTEAERERLITRLERSLADVKTLTGLLPICAGCKKVRDDSGYWHSVEAYLSRHSDAQLSHAMCPDCVRRYYPDDADEILARDAEAE